MNIAIFGAAGFIGTNLSIVLARNRKNYITLVDEREDYFNKSPVANRKNVRVYIADYNKKSSFAEAVSGCDLVFHLISTTCPATSNQSIAEEISVNVSVTVSLLEACVKARIGRFIFISSGGTVYGQKMCPVSEKEMTDPVNTYGIQKLAIEKLLFLYHHLYGLEYKIARLSNPYGPYQRPNGRLGALTTFLYKALHEEKITIYGNGNTVRDYLYIDDVIRALLVLSTERCSKNIYNIGSGTGTSLNELIGLIEQETGLKLETEYLPARSVDLEKNILDVSRFETEFGKIQTIKLAEGIRKLITFLL